MLGSLNVMEFDTCQIRRSRLPALVVSFGVLLLVACGSSRPSVSDTRNATVSSPRAATSERSSPAPPTSRAAASLQLTSPAFGDDSAIPQRYSCSGANESPPLAWRGAPGGAVELALVLDDPDAVGGRYIHWVVVGISAGNGHVRAGQLPAGAIVLPNSGGDRSYLGPCPPSGSGTHHYRFTLYALRTDLRPAPGTPALAAEAAIKRAALGQAQLVGLHSG